MLCEELFRLNLAMAHLPDFHAGFHSIEKFLEDAVLFLRSELTTTQGPIPTLIFSIKAKEIYSPALETWETELVWFFDFYSNQIVRKEFSIDFSVAGEEGKILFTTFKRDVSVVELVEKIKVFFFVCYSSVSLVLGFFFFAFFSIFFILFFVLFFISSFSFQVFCINFLVLLFFLFLSFSFF